MARGRPHKKNGDVHKELEGLDIKINAFGEIIFNTDIKKINDFLNRHVPDNLLENRNDNLTQKDFAKGKTGAAKKKKTKVKKSTKPKGKTPKK